MKLMYTQHFQDKLTSCLSHENEFGNFETVLSSKESRVVSSVPSSGVQVFMWM